MHTWIYGVIGTVVLTPFFAWADPIIRTGESVSVDETQVLEGNFYGAGSTITISGIAKKDAYILGGSVTSNGTIEEDLTIVGGVIQIHGPVRGDVRVFGSDVTIAEDVSGDVVVVGGSLKILSTAQIEGDVLIYGTSLDISGNVEGTLHGYAGVARLYGSFARDVSLTVETELTLGERASLLGMLTYTSPTELQRAQNTRIDGEIIHQKPIVVAQSFSLQLFLFNCVFLMLVALTFHQLFGKKYDISILSNRRTPWYTLSGLGFFIVTPIVALALIATLGGALLGIALISAYICVTIVSVAFGAILVGQFAARYIRVIEPKSFLSPIYGSILWVILSMIPLVGPAVCVALSIFACGVLLVHSRDEI